MKRSRCRRPSGTGPIRVLGLVGTAWAALAVLAVLSGCQGETDDPDAGIGREEAADAASSEGRDAAAQPEADTMSDFESFERLPAGYDRRLTAVLAEEMPEDVIVSFYYIGAGKNPSANYRWQLHEDGRLFLSRHSGQNLRSDVIFDRPLPNHPTTVLTADEIDDLYAHFEQSDFFQQPGFQRNPRAEDGSYVIVRARQDSRTYEVVYQNVEEPPVDYLYDIGE